jgi:hypothetical protein
LPHVHELERLRRGAHALPAGVGARRDRYRESPIEQNRWRLSFSGGDDASIKRVRALAMRRAADLTLAKGYDWLIVTDRTIEGPAGAENAGEASLAKPPGAVTVILEVMLGRGAAPLDPDAYDARAIRRRMGPQV